MNKIFASSSTHMAIAAFFFSLMGVVVKSLKGLPTHEIVFFRGIITAFYCLTYLQIKNISPWGNNKKILLLRGASGSVALYLFFYSISVLQLSEATAIQKLSPLFVVLMMAAIGKAKINGKQILVFIIALVGVYQLKNVSVTGSPVDYLMALAAALLAGVAYSCINILKESEHPLVIMFYFPLITTIFMSPYTITHWVSPSPMQWVQLILMGTFIQIAQYFITLAYQRGEPGKIGPVYYLEIVLSGFWGFLFYAEVLTMSQLAGIGIILFSLFLNSKFK